MSCKSRRTVLIASSLIAITSLSTGAAAQQSDDLSEGFANPPNDARPRVWWHWIDGNITKDGIAKDLAWMKRIGIGGAQTFDIAQDTSAPIVDKRLVYMSPEWKEAFRFAAAEADRLNLELTIASSPGWSETGGPWVQRKDGLKKLVWSEIQISGGKRYGGKLAVPPGVTGPFQSIAAASGFRAHLPADQVPQSPTFYQDVAVLAFPLEQASGLLSPIVRSGGGKPLDGGALIDPDLNSAVTLPSEAGRSPTIVLEYPTAQTIRSATLYLPGGFFPFLGSPFAPVLEASNDGNVWRKLADVPVAAVPTTLSFAPITAKQFRVTFNASTTPTIWTFADPSPGTNLTGLDAMVRPVSSLAGVMPVMVGELRLSSEDRIDRYEAKAGFEIERDYYQLSRNVPDAKGVDPARVIDLTSRLKPDATLDWSPPSGRWRILRLGYSLLGTTNHPAPAEATGLEVDKFDGAAVRRYLEHYMTMYREAAGTELVGKRGVQAILTDSYEVGAANWTPQLIQQFKRLRGYDPVPWLPSLTGTIIGSRGQSDKFLYDYRRTLADLMASEHYGTVAQVARENGLKVYGEAMESGRPALGDDMSMRRFADIPMAAMWTRSRKDGPMPAHIADIRGAASVAHVYGQNLVAAESLTSALAYWDHAPADLKRIIDLAFVHGVNRPVIHTSVHVPLEDKKPGLSLGMFGQYFNRNESWAELARPWVDYLARNSFMLQQGRNVADVAYFYGEDAPLTALYEDHPVADAPSGYGYDFVNADALLGALSNDGAGIGTPGGARYRVLYLGGSSRKMTLPVLRKISTLVRGGATLVGRKPESSPSLADHGAADEFERLVAQLWPGTDVAQVERGRVIATGDIEAALAHLGVAPDFRYTSADPDGAIPFVHRKLPDGDTYFLVNQKDRPRVIEARFRVAGKVPELWHAETGKSEPVSYRIDGNETVVPLTLLADQSVHVVFRRPATVQSTVIDKPALRTVSSIEGPWTVKFQPERGAPPTISLPTLRSLSEHSEPGVRYFSGIATYTKSFTLPNGIRPGDPLWIDLGKVGDIAEVRVNGRSVGSAWHAPYRINISGAVRNGANQLEIRLANRWVNRLIGDAQAGAEKVTWTAMPTYKADAPLRPSGLIGRVTLLAPASLKAGS